MGFWVFDPSESKSNTNSVPTFSSSSSSSTHNNGDDDLFEASSSKSISNYPTPGNEFSIPTCNSVANYQEINDTNDTSTSSVASCKKIDDMNSQIFFKLGSQNDRQMMMTVQFKGDGIVGFDLQNQIAVNGSMIDGKFLPANNLPAEIPPLDNLTNNLISKSDNVHLNSPDAAYNQSTRVQLNSNAQRKDSVVLETDDSLKILVNNSFQNPVLESSFPSSVLEHIFVITDISHMWAFSTETTKILIVGWFDEKYLHLAKSNLLCVCGDTCVRAEIIQAGVYRCLVSPHSPGLVKLFLSLDGHKPISQVVSFEYRSKFNDPVVSSKEKPDFAVSCSEDNPECEEFKLKMRLAHLLFSTSKTLNKVLPNEISPTTLMKVKMFAHKTSDTAQSWEYLMKSVEDSRVPSAQAKDDLLELNLKNMLKEWLLERIIEGCKSTEYDADGRGVIHLCAILGYTWAVYLFSWSGLSLNYRDKHGWTALHWAAFYGREKMVAVLLSAGAKSNIVTDSTSEHPGGRTAADLAAANGYYGLADYLSMNSLAAHFEDMSLAGNVSGTLQTSEADTVTTVNLCEEEMYLRDTLAACQTATDAAARILAAFREHSSNIVDTVKICNAFGYLETMKKMEAAARILSRFRAWKIRKDFLNKRRQAIKIQAAFRGYQVRKQHHKIVRSVRVLEKAILQWRLKRKGFTDVRQGNDPEKDFFNASRKQAEERVERSVIQVLAMFRSKKEQQEYQRMKLAHHQAEMEYKELQDNDMDVE